MLKICKTNVFSNFQKSRIRSSHYFVIPEISNDNPTNNPIMRQEKIPLYNELKPRNILTGVLKQSTNFESDLHKLISNYDEIRKSITISEILASLEKSLAPMDQGFKISRHMAYVNPYSQFMSVFLSLQETIKIRKNMRWSNRKFYEILKISSELEPQSNEFSYIIKKYKTYFEMNGLNLNEKDYARFQDLNWKIFEEQNNFKKKLKFSTEKFSFLINEKSTVSELPKEIKKMISTRKHDYENGPWIVTLNDDVYSAFMKYCSNQQIRKHLFDNFYGRASYLNESPFQNNSETIKNLISLRNQKANVLGCKNYAELSLKTKSAANPENVIELLEATKLRQVNDEEYSTLQNYACKNGHIGILNIYDIDYWKNKFHTELYGGLDAQTMQYFPWKNVLDATFKLCKSLFEIDFIETKEFEDRLWNDNVLIYDVYENGKYVSTLSIDPFLRTGKIDSIWAYSGRDSSKVSNSKPIAHLVLNLRNVGSNTLMNMAQLKQFFSQFGKCLQILLTQVDHGDSSDLSTMELDALSLTSKVFERLLYVPEILTRLSSNQNNGTSIPYSLLKTIQSENSHISSFGYLRQCYLSAFDIESHISDKYWTEIMEELWPKYMPTKLLKNDFHPCQLVAVFGDNFGVSFYSDLWAEMLAADIFEAFEEIGFQNEEKIISSFKRYRNTFLLYGSSLPTNEIFRRFRGRNPSFQPFIKSFKLN